MVEMKKAFFVFGPEGSGTYMLAEAFVSAGCFYDDKLREYVPNNFRKKVVARLSLPCAGEFINPKALYLPYMHAGYDCKFFVILRDANASRQSILGREPERGFKRVWDEYGQALLHIANILPISALVSYEAFVSNAGYRKWLFDSFCGLDEPKGQWFNGNKKYYE